jgi:hypothetical protein
MPVPRRSNQTDTGPTSRNARCGCSVLRRRSAAACRAGYVRSGCHAVLWDKKDRYGRTLGKVMVDGTDVCLEQIKAGLAWHYKRYASEQPAQDKADYAAAEDRAKGERIGLWANAQPTAPWDWRKK